MTGFTNAQKLEFFDRLWTASTQPIIPYQFPLQRPTPFPLPYPGEFIVFEAMKLPELKERLALDPMWESGDVLIDMVIEEAERCVVAVPLVNGLRNRNVAAQLMRGERKFPEGESIFRWCVTVGRPLPLPA